MCAEMSMRHAIKTVKGLPDYEQEGEVKQCLYHCFCVCDVAST